MLTYFPDMKCLIFKFGLLPKYLGIINLNLSVQKIMYAIYFKEKALFFASGGKLILNCRLIPNDGVALLDP